MAKSLNDKKLIGIDRPEPLSAVHSSLELIQRNLDASLKFKI